MQRYALDGSFGKTIIINDRAAPTWNIPPIGKRMTR